MPKLRKFHELMFPSQGKGLMVTYWLTGKEEAVKASTEVTEERGVLASILSNRHTPLPSSSSSSSGVINNGYNIYEETKKRLDNINRTSTTENTQTDLHDPSSIATF